jgi:hypothetical protein
LYVAGLREPQLELRCLPSQRPLQAHSHCTIRVGRYGECLRYDWSSHWIKPPLVSRALIPLETTSTSTPLRPRGRDPLFSLKQELATLSLLSTSADRMAYLTRMHTLRTSQVSFDAYEFSSLRPTDQYNSETDNMADYREGLPADLTDGAIGKSVRLLRLCKVSCATDLLQSGLCLQDLSSVSHWSF